MARKRGSRQGTRETSSWEHFYNFVERLVDSPVDDGLICCDRVISHIDDSIAGLKQFITNVNVNSVNVQSSKTTEEGDNSKTSANDVNIEKIAGDLLIEASNLNPVLSAILHEINSWDWDLVRALRDKLMDYAVFDWVSDIKDDTRDIKKDISIMLSDRARIPDMHGDVKKVVKSVATVDAKIAELDSVIRGVRDVLNDHHSEITELELSTYQGVITEASDIKELMRQYHNANNTWFETIYDKLVECCVKDDVMDLLSKSDMIQADIDYVKNRLDGAPSARQQAVEGETRSQLKAIQAQLAEIRGLL